MNNVLLVVACIISMLGGILIEKIISEYRITDAFAEGVERGVEVGRKLSDEKFMRESLELMTDNMNITNEFLSELLNMSLKSKD